MAAAGEKLLFASDGYTPFGKVAIMYIPGSISVSVDQEGGFASLDGDTAVSLPHIFENVIPGDHKVRILDIKVAVPVYKSGLKKKQGLEQIDEKTEIYEGVEESVSVESGKQFKLHPDLNLGKAGLRVEEIPKGSTLLIDEDECSLATIPGGSMVFDGTILAGSHKLMIVNGNETGISNILLPVNESKTYSYSTQFFRWTTLPKASIKIDGNFDEWNSIPAIITSGTQSPANKNMAIDKVYLAVDDNNLYWRIDIKDATPSSHSHPNNFDSTHHSDYIINLQKRNNHIGVSILFWPGDGQWKIHPYQLVGGKSEDIEKAGKFQMKGSYLEASFPLNLIKKYLGALTPGTYYKVYVNTGYNDTRDRWLEDSGDRTEEKWLQF